MIPLMVAGGLAQGALGFFRAKQQQAQAKRAAGTNNALASNDAIFGAFNKDLNGGRKMGAVSDEGPSALGGALKGAMSGAMQGQNIYAGMQDSAMKGLRLDKLKRENLMSSLQGGGAPTMSAALDSKHLNAYRMPTMIG